MNKMTNKKTYAIFNDSNEIVPGTEARHEDDAWTKYQEQICGPRIWHRFNEFIAFWEGQGYKSGLVATKSTRNNTRFSEVGKMQTPETTFDDMRWLMNQIATHQEDYTAVEIIEILKGYIAEFEKSVLVFGKEIKISKMEVCNGK